MNGAMGALQRPLSLGRRIGASVSGNAGPLFPRQPMDLEGSEDGTPALDLQGSIVSLGLLNFPRPVAFGVQPAANGSVAGTGRTLLREEPDAESECIPALSTSRGIGGGFGSSITVLEPAHGDGSPARVLIGMSLLNTEGLGSGGLVVSRLHAERHPASMHGRLPAVGATGPDGSALSVARCSSA